jgi:hypothetical protein
MAFARSPEPTPMLAMDVPADSWLAQRASARARSAFFAELIPPSKHRFTLAAHRSR